MDKKFGDFDLRPVIPRAFMIPTNMFKSDFLRASICPQLKHFVPSMFPQPKYGTHCLSAVTFGRLQSFIVTVTMTNKVLKLVLFGMKLAIESVSRQ